MMTMRVLFVGALCLFVSSALCEEVDFRTTKARVTYEASTHWVDGVGPLEDVTIKVQGEINKDTIALIGKYYAKVQHLGALNVHLNSGGGDVEAALEVGRFIRSVQANVMVTDDARCASACVFILAGGAYRHVSGKLGIHRPFLETALRPMTIEDVKAAANRTKQRLRSYFNEMNISERLADDMMVIPSNEIRWLSAQDIANYGLGVDDPVLREARVLSRAQKYGLSRMEYEVRWQRVREICVLGSAPDCEDRIMKGQ